MDTANNPFPVEWANPEDAQAFWIMDAIHCPEPMSRLDYDLRMQPLLEANAEQGDQLGFPLSSEPRLIHGFIYNKLINRDVSMEELPGILQACDTTVRERYQDLAGSWSRTWLPEIQKHLAELSALAPRSASLSEVLAGLPVARARIRDLWELHSKVITPSVLALCDFDDAYRDLFPGSKPLDVYDLVGGFSNKTLEGNIRLWEIGRSAARSPALRSLIAETAPASLMAVLSETEEGRALQGAIDEYVRTYGERNDDLITDKPTWIDDPTPVLRGLREAVLQPDRDLAADLAQQAARREARLAQVREALAAHPRTTVDEFERLLREAQTANVLSEEHHFFIDCKVTYHARRVAMEAGRRLRELGVLEREADVFQLSIAELSALGGDLSEEAKARARELVGSRRAEATRFAGVAPPMMLGVPRPFLPMDCAVTRAMAKFSGNIFAPPGAPGSDLVGMPGSAGKVRGPARIIRSLEQTSKLRPGDILVAAFTLPSWTPFFGSVAGVVTNIGGMLCHSAVVAREYGIPAVVGTVRATETYTDGQLIEVDGDAGIVRPVQAQA